VHYLWKSCTKVVWCFVVAVAVTIAITVVVTSYQLCQLCGALSFSSDVPILRQFHGDSVVYPRKGLTRRRDEYFFVRVSSLLVFSSEYIFFMVLLDY
jgi:hypothetical protein